MATRIFTNLPNTNGDSIGVVLSSVIAVSVIRRGQTVFDVDIKQLDGSRITVAQETSQASAETVRDDILGDLPTSNVVKITTC